MNKVEYEVIMRDSYGREQKLNGLTALCEMVWDVCFAIGVDYGDDPSKKELVKTANYVCKWVGKLGDMIRKENE